MAKENFSNDHKKRDGKKAGRRFGNRRENYVDSFRWGFVEGTEQEDAAPDDDFYFAPEEVDVPPEAEQLKPNQHSKRERPKKSVKSSGKSDSKPVTETKEPQAKQEKPDRNPKEGNPRKNRNDKPAGKKSLPPPSLIEDDDDDDLNLPSYGRTPVPKDEELPKAQPQRERQQEKPKRDREVSKPQERSPKLPKPDYRTEKQPLQKTQPKSQLRVERVAPEEPELPCSADVLSKPHKEQMVWDPDKREYVPLVIPETIRNKIKEKALDKKCLPRSLPPQTSDDRKPVQKAERNFEQNRRNQVNQVSQVKIPEWDEVEQEPEPSRGTKKHSRKRSKTSSPVSKPVQDSRTEKKPVPRSPERERNIDSKIDTKSAPKTATGTNRENPDRFRSKNQREPREDLKPRRQPEPKPKFKQEFKQEPKQEYQRDYQQEYRQDYRQEYRRPASAQRGGVQAMIESKVPSPADVEAEVSGFAELGVSETMLESLKIARYLAPTPIQAGVFKQLKAGVDVMGQAQTGTGKTAAFCIPLIEGVEECPPGNDPVAIILVPTRELAVQVRDEAIKLAYGRDIRISACYGGKPLAKQIERLRDGVDMIVGTPGRVLDLIKRGALSLSYLRWVVLDEADRMLDIGFRPDIEKILKLTPAERQTLLFSATLPAPVVKLAERYMKTPEILDFSNKSVAVETIEQFYVTVDPERKFDALVYLLNEQQPNQAIIFTRTKRGADRLARLLQKRFDSLAAIHGDLAQGERDRVMTQFRAGKLRYLVATDVVGRGIDVSGISHIINYDIPAFCDDYIHRVGRTGRMGREGVAYTFVTVQEGSELTRIEMRIDKLLKRAELKGFESFTKPSDPNIGRDDDEASVETRPVYGKPVRKIRRAL